VNEGQTPTPEDLIRWGKQIADARGRAKHKRKFGEPDQALEAQIEELEKRLEKWKAKDGSEASQ
jgi:hypothetical protein